MRSLYFDQTRPICYHDDHGLASQGRQQPQGNMPCFATTTCAWHAMDVLLDIGIKGYTKLVIIMLNPTSICCTFFWGGFKMYFYLLFGGGRGTTHIFTFLYWLYITHFYRGLRHRSDTEQGGCKTYSRGGGGTLGNCEDSGREDWGSP